MIAYHHLFKGIKTMPHTSPSPRVAVLIDGDNTQLEFATQILDISKHYGSIAICRAYADWKQLPSLHKKLLTLNIDLVQQDRIGKNATDHRLVIEAVKILEANKADTFIIVSSDGDFTVLCQELKDQKKQVIGIGSRLIISKTLPGACTDFLYLEDLEKKLKKPVKPQAAVSPQPNELESLIEKILLALPRSKKGWAQYPQLLDKMREEAPNFESKLGGKRFATWLKDHKRFERRLHLIRMI
jgi:uncharacterized LabA/DUF88 family protein